MATNGDLVRPAGEVVGSASDAFINRSREISRMICIHEQYSSERQLAFLRDRGPRGGTFSQPSIGLAGRTSFALVQVGQTR